jgi:hypothetical protein
MNQYDAIIEHYSRRPPDAPTTQYEEIIECCTRIATEGLPPGLKSCDVAMACFVEDWLCLAPALGYEATTPEELAIQMGYVGYKPSLARRRKENRRHRETMIILQETAIQAHRAVEREHLAALDRCKTDRRRRQECIRAYADYKRKLLADFK